MPTAREYLSGWQSLLGKVDGARTVVQISGVTKAPEVRYVRSCGASLAWQFQFQDEAIVRRFAREVMPALRG